MELKLLITTAPPTLPSVLTLLIEPSSLPNSSFAGSVEVGVVAVVAGVVGVEGVGVGVGGVTTGSGMFTSIHSFVFRTLIL